MQLTRNPNLTASINSLPSERVEIPFTGKAPSECPGLREDGALTSLPLPHLEGCTRQDVQDYFDNTWTLTEVLFQSLVCREAFYSSPYHQLRHPLVFYFAHPAVLYLNKLRVAGLLEEGFDPYYETLFETGVDEMSWDDMSKNEMPWPELDAVIDYRRRTYAAVCKLIATHPGLAAGHAPIGWQDPLWALFMGFEHERIHIETTSVLIRELPVEWIERPKHWPADAPAGNAGGAQPMLGEHFPATPFVAVEAETARLGKPRDWPSFGWDNEYGEDERAVEPFVIGRHLISNGEFHGFVAAGGYREERFWSETGWKWRNFRNVKWPTFWVGEGPTGLGQFKLRTTFEVVDMPWSWPAVVNFHEAKAYAMWRAQEDEVSYRLPTEAEHAILRGEVACDPVMKLDGAAMQSKGWNLNLAWGSEGPVDAFQATAAGVHDAVGNVWCWVEDDFHPLPGAEVHPYYDDFSTPCYDGEHTMILGGAFVSTGDEASGWARFHFRPHFFQHAGFHLVRSEADGSPVQIDPGDTQGGKYEQAAVLAQYLELHYGSPEEAMPIPEGPRSATEFPRRCADLVIDAAAELGISLERSLDLGCAVGRASFELARACPDVTGIDLSAAFVDTCQELARQGELPYEAVDEGELSEARVARVDPDIERGRVTFRRADAMGLPPELEGFDAVLAANLIDRLPSPGACLRRMGGPRGLVRPGGLLVVCSPYTWYEEFTPREVWLGGLERDGAPQRSAEGLRAVLQGEFDLVREVDLPFVIREHRRKFELVISHATVWRRKG